MSTIHQFIIIYKIQGMVTWRSQIRIIRVNRNNKTIKKMFKSEEFSATALREKGRGVIYVHVY